MTATRDSKTDRKDFFFKCLRELRTKPLEHLDMHGNDEGDEPAMGGPSEEVSVVSFKCACVCGKEH